MNTPVWLIDLRGDVELTDGTSSLDGVIVRAADRAILGVGIKTGFISKRTVWTTIDRLVRASGSRTWLAVRGDQLNDRPPDGVWLRSDLPIRHHTTPLGTIGWAGVSDGTLVELGIIPLDPRILPRRVRADTIVALNDRSVQIDIDDVESAPLLRTDRELEEEVRRRLWDTAGSLPPDMLERISVSVNGGVVTLSGMVSKNHHRDLAVTIAHEPMEVRGVVDRIETAEGLADSALRIRASA